MFNSNHFASAAKHTIWYGKIKCSHAIVDVYGSRVNFKGIVDMICQHINDTYATDIPAPQ